MLGIAGPTGARSLMGSGACFLPLARTLQAEFDVLLPDARKHGSSSATADSYLKAIHNGWAVLSHRS